MARHRTQQPRALIPPSSAAETAPPEPHVETCSPFASQMACPTVRDAGETRGRAGQAGLQECSSAIMYTITIRERPLPTLLRAHSGGSEREGSSRKPEFSVASRGACRRTLRPRPRRMLRLRGHRTESGGPHPRSRDCTRHRERCKVWIRRSFSGGHSRLPWPEAYRSTRTVRKAGAEGDALHRRGCYRFRRTTLRLAFYPHRSGPTGGSSPTHAHFAFGTMSLDHLNLQR